MLKDEFLSAEDRIRIAGNVRCLDELHPDARAAVVELLERMFDLGLEPRIVSARRSCFEQRALHARGRTSVNGCYSWHVQGRAVDLDASRTTRGAWEHLGSWWTAKGGVWGGTLPQIYDPKHFEWHPDVEPDLCADCR